MTLTSRKQVSLYQEAKAGLSSLARQTATVFLGFIVMLVITGGTPSVFVITLSVVLGGAFVAWSEQKRVSESRSGKSDVPSDSSITNSRESQESTDVEAQTVSSFRSSNSLIAKSQKHIHSKKYQACRRSLASYLVGKSTQEPSKTFIGRIKLSSGSKVYLRTSLPGNGQGSSLVRSASQIRYLINQFTQTHPGKSLSERMLISTKVLEEIERNPRLKLRVLKLIESGKEAVLKERINDPCADILLATLETSRKKIKSSKE